jgi:hypothetical protein
VLARVDQGDQVIMTKLHDFERLKVELQLARIRALEQGKAFLLPEQYEKLQSLLGPDSQDSETNGSAQP